MVKNLVRRSFGFLAIAACAAMISYLLCASFGTYLLTAVMPGDPGWAWDAWLACGELLLAVCGPLLAFIFWAFGVRRAMFATWIFRIFGASTLVLSAFAFGYVGLCIAFGSLTEALGWTAWWLARAAALLALGAATLVLTRPKRRRQAAEMHGQSVS